MKNTADRIRVLIADDHPIVRQGLEVVINSQPDMILIGQATDGEEVVKMNIGLQPDVVVMDLKMPVMNGLKAMQEMKKSGLESKVLVLTSFPEDNMVILAIQAGANGVLLKDSPPEQLLDAIRAVSRGESALHPSVIQQLIKEVRHSVKPEPVDHLLTPREIDVLNCLAQGLSNREIALKLSISTRTVTTHVRNILDKLGLENRTQAALFAVDKGLPSSLE